MDAVHPGNKKAVRTTQKDEPASYLGPDIKMNCSQETLIISGPLSQNSSHTIISVYRAVIHISSHLQICQFSFVTIEPNGQFEANCSEVSKMLNFHKQIFKISCHTKDRELFNDLITEEAKRACP